MTDSRRSALKQKLASERIVIAPGIYDMISVRITDRMGFDSLYMTGFGTVASYLGEPDAGLATYTDMVGRVAAFCGSSVTPIVCDGDTGYGGLLNVAHTVLGGHLDFAATSISSATSLVQAGKVRALAVSSPKRNAALPDVPSVTEAGYKDYAFVTYYGVLGPAGLPQPIVTRLNADLNKILQTSDVRAAFQAQGLEPNPMSPNEFAALVKADIQKSKEAIAAANIKVE